MVALNQQRRDAEERQPNPVFELLPRLLVHRIRQGSLQQLNENAHFPLLAGACAVRRRRLPTQPGADPGGACNRPPDESGNTRAEKRKTQSDKVSPAPSSPAKDAERQRSPK